MEDIAAHQGVQFAYGDILIIKTGFLEWYEAASEREKLEAFEALNFAGVQQGSETERWLWDHRISAVAGDSVSWECKCNY